MTKTDEIVELAGQLYKDHWRLCETVAALMIRSDPVTPKREDLPDSRPTVAELFPETGGPEPAPTDKEKSLLDHVDRFELIDERGRFYVRYGIAVELSYQDQGRTLKAWVRQRDGQGQSLATLVELRQLVADLLPLIVHCRENEPIMGRAARLLKE